MTLHYYRLAALKATNDALNSPRFAIAWKRLPTVAGGGIVEATAQRIARAGSLPASIAARPDEPAMQDAFLRFRPQTMPAIVPERSPTRAR